MSRNTFRKNVTTFIIIIIIIIIITFFVFHLNLHQFADGHPSHLTAARVSTVKAMVLTNYGKNVWKTAF